MASVSKNVCIGKNADIVNKYITQPKLNLLIKRVIRKILDLS